VAAIYAALTARQAGALDRDFLSFATQNNTGPAGGPAELNYQYIRVIARRARSGCSVRAGHADAGISHR
jgi:hypothetical protein